MATDSPINIPKTVFIVPYRNRPQHKFFFSKYMSFILEDNDEYEIYFSHQCDIRTFNRGATKNIGFLAIKNKYPEHYKDITFVFNDVDTIPFNKIFDYKTTHGVVKHYYGYKYALGGIVVIKGADFEKTNGYPCFWGWGLEDNVLQKRCDRLNIKIDRSVFYNIGSPEILQLFDGISRIISKKDPWRMEHDNGMDGLSAISKLDYSIDNSSYNAADNIFTVHNDRIFIINVKTFLTYIRFEQDKYYTYDLREPKRKIIHPDKIKETTSTLVTTDNWSNIPYYPTTRERRENIAKYLMSQNKPVPQSLLKQIEEDKQKEIELDSFNNFNNNNNYSVSNTDDSLQNNNTNTNQPHSIQLNTIRQNNNTNTNQPHSIQLNTIRQNSIHQNNIHQNNIHQNNIHQNHFVPNKFSREYAQYIGQKPRAQPSIRIGLGGVV
jgi:hypothetical protein